MTLSILIVNYKTPNLVIDCIESIYQFDSDGIEVIVIDNDSSDGIEEKLTQQFPHVVFIQMGYNAGFARANNAGMSVAKAKHFLLLNSDTIVLDNAIQRCLQHFVGSEFVACGVQLLNKDLSEQISGNYALKGGLNYLLPLPVLGSFFKWLGTQIGLSKPHLPASIGINKVDWVNGAFLMVKKSAVEKAGTMDEEFFLYAEEAEWCSRLKKVGEIAIFGDCKVIHLQGESSADAFSTSSKGYSSLHDKMGFQIMLSNFVRIRKQFGLFWYFIIFSIYLLEIPFYFLSILIKSTFSPNSLSKRLKLLFGFSRNVFSCFRFLYPIVFKKKCFYKVL